MRTSWIGILMGCASLAFITTGAQAADGSRPLEAAWKAAMMDFEGVLTDEQHTSVNSIAYHSATARLCDGLELDVDKVGKLMNALATVPDTENTPDDVQLERLTNILVTLGTIKGLMLAEGAMDKDKFCAAALKAKADAEVEHLWK
jgi:hypothetical protein